MKFLKILMLLVFSLLFTSTAYAITSYGEWQNGANSITIDRGDQVYFDYALFSVNAPISYNLKMYDSNTNLISTFISSSSSNNLISDRQTISQLDYRVDGIYSIIISGVDNIQDTSASTLLLQVGDGVNNAPVLNAIGNQQVNEGNLLQFTVTATDADNDPLTLTVTGLPTNAQFTNNNDGTGTFSWQTNYNDAGIYNLRFTAGDSVLTDFEDVRITVIDIPQVNNVPVLSIIAPIQNEVIFGNYNILWQATDQDQTANTLDIRIEYRDPNNPNNGINTFLNTVLNLFGIQNILTHWITLENLQDNNDGTFTWNTNTVQDGSYELRISVIDDNNNLVSNTVQFSINNAIGVNNNPVITSTPIIFVQVNNQYNYDVNAVDADNDPITYVLTTAPQGMTIDTNTGLISWTPSTIGNYNIVLEARDNRNGVAQQSYILYVIRSLTNQNLTTKATEKHEFMISNIVLKQNNDDLNLLISLKNEGNNKEKINLFITDLTTGKRMESQVDLSINEGTWKIIILRNMEKGNHVIKVDAISKAFKYTRYGYIKIR